MPTTLLTPLALKDAPSLIERVFPAQKVSAEAQKERKAGAGQTLTALGVLLEGAQAADYGTGDCAGVFAAGDE